MSNFKILDCTLRDGGFANGWNFGHSCINNIVERLGKANIDIIEVGYIRDYASYDKNSTQFPDIKSINNTLNRSQYPHMLVALMDYGDCTIDRICDVAQSVVDGVRITFKKENCEDALRIAEQIKEKGYHVFIQPVVITDYNGMDIVNLAERINQLDPYAVCMVDTYGFMNRRDLEKYFYLFDSCLNPDIALGYHSHNNYQLSYANAIDLLDKATQRLLIIDASVFGMGKGAGNLNTELIAAYINTNIECRYNIDQILEIINMYTEKERDKEFWGYTLKYYIAAATNSHHKYVQYLLGKKTLTIEAINRILHSIADDKKTRYDQVYIAQLYEAFQDNEIADASARKRLKTIIGNRKILVLSPGQSLKTERIQIDRYIEKENPCIVSVNHYIRNYKQDMIFISNGIRYAQLENECINAIDIPVIATSNISYTTLKPSYIVNYRDLLLEEEEIQDNAVLMMLKLLKHMGISEVSIAGFDGFSHERSHNYYADGISLVNDLSEKNKKIANAFNELCQEMNVSFITTSIYQQYQ